MNHRPTSAPLLTLTLLLGCSAATPDKTTGGAASSVASSSGATSSSSSGGSSSGGSSSGGSSSGGGGAGGSADMLDGPIDRGGLLVLEWSSLYFEVDPSIGARISALRLNGIDLLTDATVNAVNWGSTF